MGHGIMSLGSPSLNLMRGMQATFSRYNKHALFLLVVMISAFFVGSAEAITAPTATGFAFDVYDVIVNKVLKGPIGFVGGLAAIVVGAASLTKSWMMAIMGVLSGTLIIKADTITASLGLVVGVL